MSNDKFKVKIKSTKEDVLTKLHQAKLNQLSLIEIAHLEGELEILELVDKMCIERGRY